MEAGQKLPDFPEHLVWLNVAEQEQDTWISPGCRYYLFYFWSLECPACQMISPSLIKRCDDPAKVQIIFIHVPLYEGEKSIERVKEKAVKMGVAAQVILDHQYEIASLFGVQGIPSLYLFDQERRLIYAGMGEDGYHTAIQHIDHATTA